MLHQLLFGLQLVAAEPAGRVDDAVLRRQMIGQIRQLVETLIAQGAPVRLLARVREDVVLEVALLVEGLEDGRKGRLIINDGERGTERIGLKVKEK